MEWDECLYSLQQNSNSDISQNPSLMQVSSNKEWLALTFKDEIRAWYRTGAGLWQCNTS